CLPPSSRTRRSTSLRCSYLFPPGAIRMIMAQVIPNERGIQSTTPSNDAHHPWGGPDEQIIFPSQMEMEIEIFRRSLALWCARRHPRPSQPLGRTLQGWPPANSPKNGFCVADQPSGSSSVATAPRLLVPRPVSVDQQ